MKPTSPALRRLARQMLQALPRSLADRLRGMKRKAMNLRSRRDVFRRIAEANAWDGTESVSGPGSTLAATAAIRAALPGLLERYGVKVFLDIPCGDAYWISQALPDGIDYIGADIVPDLIARNRAEKGEIGCFEVLDIVSDDLPRADMVMVRDCFIHLPHRMVGAAIANVKRSGARYLLTTTYPGRADNTDIEIGGFRPIDLQRAPYNLPDPLEIVLEIEGAISGKSIAVWDVTAL